MKYIFKIFGIVVCLLMMAGTQCSAQTKESKKNAKLVFMAGKKALQKGDTLTAIAQFEETLALDSSISAAQSLLDKVKAQYSGGNVPLVAENTQPEEKEEKKEAVVETTESNVVEDVVETVVEEISQPQEKVEEIVNEAYEEIIEESQIEEIAENVATQETKVKEVAEEVKQVSQPKKEEQKAAFSFSFGGNVISAIAETKPAQEEAKNEVKAEKPAVEKQPVETKPNNQKKAAATRPVEPPTKDVLIKAIRAAKEEQVFGFSHMPTAPLLSLAKENAEANFSGKWMSSIHNYDFDAHEMLFFTVSPSMNLVTLEENSCGIIEIGKKNGYECTITENTVADGKIKIDLAFQSNKKERKEVEKFFNTLLRPYFGQMHVGNYDVYHWMVDGEYIPDMKVNQRVIHDTINTKMNGYEMVAPKVYVKDSVAYDTIRFTKHIKPALFSINMHLTFEISPSDKLMPANLHVHADMEALKKNFVLADFSTPMYFVHLSDDFEPLWTYSDTITAESVSDVDIIKIAEVLSAGREKNDVDALVNSADILLDYPNADHAQAFGWLETARKKDDKNSNSLFVLADAKLRGVGTEKNLDEAIELYRTASMIAEDNLDGGYYLAVFNLELGSKSQAYIDAMNNAQIGSPRAMQMIAEVMFTGSLGRRADPRIGLAWFKKLYEKYGNKMPEEENTNN